MKPTFCIKSDRATNLVEMTLTGFFDTETVGRLRAERDLALSKLTCPPGTHFTLCDASGCLTQRQDVVGLFMELASNAPRVSRRLAFVVPSAMGKMQLRRAVPANTEVRMFDHRAEAVHWLAEAGASIGPEKN